MKKQEVLQVKKLNKFFGHFQAVKDLNLNIKKGEIFALLGHNGAGKSTLIKMILGLVYPSGGEIIVEGLRQDGHNLAIKNKIGYLPERMNFYDNLTAWETIVFYAKLKGLPLIRCEEALEQVGLTEFKHQRVGSFSKGMQQRLGLAQATIHNPELLILDEPMTGLDPIGILELKNLIRQWNVEGTTILFSTHNLADAEELGETIGIMNKGEMIAVGSLEELQRRLKLKTKLTVDLGSNYPQLWQRLAAKGIGPLEMEENYLTLYCSKGKKAKLLKILIDEGITISDFYVEEPGLDQIYRSLVEEANNKTEGLGDCIEEGKVLGA